MILPIRLINSLNQINSLKTTFRWISSINKFTERTHNCGQLSDNDIGKSVQLFGWVQSTRFDNKIIALRDSYGSIQCILAQPELSRSFKKINIHNESIVKITGTVRLRPKGHEDANSSTGSIEVLADHLEIINKATKDLPIFTKDDHSTKTWNTRLKHRHLDLRSAEMQHALRFRSFVCQILRSKLYELNFVECETPTLYKRTPGGANEFIVPTKEPSKFYSLTQSPQQLKQLLMIGGLDRYFQICRCYRDEQTRSDRQPEFTQLDIELSFTNQELVMKLVDEIVFDLMCKISSDEEIRDFLTESFDEGRSIKRMTYSEAFRNYGTDKPDTRFAWKISEVNGKELEIRVPVAIDSPRLKEFLREEAESRGVDVELICLSDNDNHGMKYTILRSSDNSDLSRTVLGRLRLAIADHLHSSGQRVYENDFGFLWVTEFPLFILDKDGKLEPNHHPFTAPTKATENFLKEDPLKVIGQHYDLVLNGQEIAGGSIRIHDAQLQRQIFTDSLGLKEDTFEYFIEALKTGCPPHGGIAFGLDRLVAILMNKKSIRDVIAFPKSSTGRDLLSECPHELDANIKSLYHIK